MMQLKLLNMRKIYKNILFILFFIIVSSCSEETILYDEIDNPDYTINTLTLPTDKEKEINPRSKSAIMRYAIKL